VFIYNLTTLSCLSIT